MRFGDLPKGHACSCPVRRDSECEGGLSTCLSNGPCDSPYTDLTRRLAELA